MRTATGDSIPYIKRKATEILLVSLQTFHAHRKDLPEEAASEERQRLLQIRMKKQVVQEGVRLFNQKPALGIQYWSDKDLVSANEPSLDIAKLLLMSPTLDKKVLGEYFAQKTSAPVLRAFFQQYDFHQLRLDQAIRKISSAFRLPGESQQIQYIMETFADIYFENGYDSTVRRLIASSDATFVLSYAIIMLNTLLYNPNCENKRMSLDDFTNNAKGTNTGVDGTPGSFNPDYLNEIYSAIKAQEIILPHEHENHAGYDLLWTELMERSDNNTLYTQTSPAVFHRDMFELVWDGYVDGLCDAFLSIPEDDQSAWRTTIAGFRTLASVAARFGMHRAMDGLVQALAHLSRLQPRNHVVSAAGLQAINAVNLPANEMDAMLEFVSHRRTRVAATLLFQIGAAQSHAIRRSWTSIGVCLRTLFIHYVLPSRVTLLHDYVQGSVSLDAQNAPSENGDRKESGLLSTLSSYLMSSEDEKQLFVRPRMELTGALRKKLRTVVEGMHPDHTLIPSRYSHHDYVS